MCRRLVTALVVLQGFTAQACKTADEASQAKDFSQTEQTASGGIEITHYWATGVGANDQVVRGVCPGFLPPNPNKRRQKCVGDQKAVPIGTFQKNIRTMFEAQYGAGTFTSDYQSALGQWIGFLAAGQYQSENLAIPPTSRTSRFLPLMYGAVTGGDDQGSGDGGSGSGGGGGTAGTLLSTNVQFQGGGAPGELVWSNSQGAVLSRLKTRLDANCPFSLVSVATGGLAPMRFTNLQFDNDSGVWSAKQPVQPNKMVFGFQGAPGSCNLVVEDDGAAYSPSMTVPPYAMVIYSTQTPLGFAQPDRTHTFAAFLHLTPDGSVVEHVPFSWLPLASNPLVIAPGGSGSLVLGPGGRFQIGQILTQGTGGLGGEGVARLGWNFGIDNTFKKVNQKVTALGLYAISKDTYDRAAAWRQELTSNAQQALSGTTVSALGPRFLYLADDRNNFPLGCGEAKPSAMNCFHALAALTGYCLHTGILSGNPASQRVMEAYLGAGLVPTDAFTFDGNFINSITSQVRAREANGAFDSLN